MGHSTTLMTFLVRVPPSTRSVSLLGSWDNFQKPYAMHRDSRMGAEHWTGCHSFNNIICDGFIKSPVPRHGGLKMGGTYWYYYKLDDDIEFHNSAEPSTAACPMLPGQLVNVLQVPFGFSSRRPRNASAGSAASEDRTMNPKDKFLNPRPVPLPVLTRLNTSPTLPSIPFPTSRSPSSASSIRNYHSSSRDASPPTSAGSLKMFRLPRKTSSAGKARSASPGTDRVGNFKATVRSFKPPRAAHDESSTLRGRPTESSRGESISQPMLRRRHANSHSPRPMTRTGELQNPYPRPPPTIAEPEVNQFYQSNLPLRRGSGEIPDGEAAFVPPSLHSRRRQRSLSREPSPLGKSLTLPDGLDLREAIAELATNKIGGLETVREANSNMNTPQCPLTAIKTTKDGQPLTAKKLRLNTSLSGSTSKETSEDTICLDKRLPTLPNTPSSAYPPSASGDSPSKRLSQQIGEVCVAPVQSHFSDSTVCTNATSDTLEMIQTSHFSDWTNSTLTSSPISPHFSRIPTDLDTKLSQLDCPPLPMPSFPPRFDSLPNRDAADKPPDERETTPPDFLASAASCSTIASTASTSPRSDDFESWDSLALHDPDQCAFDDRYSPNIQTYSLPLHDSSSTTTMGPSKPMFQDFLNTVDASRRPTLKRGDTEHQSASDRNPVISNEGLGIAHSDSMRQLIEELSYLGGLIRE